jgi:hypothetical protein
MGFGKKLLIGLGAFVLLAVLSNIGKNERHAAQGSVASTSIAGEADDPSPGPRPVAVSDREGTLTFGKPTVKDMGGGMGMTKVMVEATNSSQSPLSCMVTATFKKGDSILATAQGAINSVPAGATRTAELMTMDRIAGYDTLKLEPSSCFPH